MLTVITGLAYPLFIWLVAQLPGLHDKAEGSILDRQRQAGRQPADRPAVHRHGRQPAAAVLPEPPVGGRQRLRPAVVEREQPRAGKHRRHARRSGASWRPATSAADAGFKPSLLTQVCSRSAAVGQLEGVGRVASVLHRRRCGRGAVGDRPPRRPRKRHPPDPGGQRQRAVLRRRSTPFLTLYEGVRVECAKYGEDYSIGQIVPIRGAAPANPAVPADAVTASGSGLDPNISPAYADIQVARVAKARHVSPDQIRAVVGAVPQRPRPRVSSVSRRSTCCNSTCNSTTSIRSRASAAGG